MKESVAIVIPVWKEGFTEYEKISLLQACRVLYKYKFILVTYRKLDISKYTDILDDNGIVYKIKHFNEQHFDSVDSYNSLLLSARFYLRFLFYKYILIHQLDCFVFRDELDYWVAMNYSYIGAPWLENYGMAEYGNAVLGVGNGGFSLRNVRHHIKSLLKYNYDAKDVLLRNFLHDSKRSRPLIKEIYQLLNKIALQNAFVFTKWTQHEDFFWGEIARTEHSWFKVPEWGLASRFSMEVQPGYFYKLNNNKLPFGCHAWWRYDAMFWKPFIEKFGYNLNDLKTD